MRAVTCLRTLATVSTRVARPLQATTTSGAAPCSPHRIHSPPVPSSTAGVSSTAAYSSTATPSASASASSSSTATSFIEHAKLHGAQSLLGTFPTGGRFDSCLSGLQITRMDATGEVEAIMTVDSKVENSYGSLHGGAISTLVDVIGTLALLAKDNKRGGVSVELNVNFLSAIKVGSKVICKGRVLKLGKTLGFTQVELFTEDGKLAAIGRHTKAM